MHPTLAAITLALTIVHLAPLHLAAFTPVIAAGTNPFANLATALLDIADTFKSPLAVLAFVLAGGAQALHSPRATSMWISAIIASAFLFGAKGMADYLQANVK